MTVIELIKKGTSMMGPQPTFVAICKKLLGLAWRVQVNHVYREGNGVADWITNESTWMSIGVYILESPPAGVESILQADAGGVEYPCMIV